MKKELLKTCMSLFVKGIVGVSVFILLLAAVFLLPGVKGEVSAQTSTSFSLSNIKHVFVIMMENHDWSAITPSAAPYIWNNLIPQGGYATNYHNVLPTSITLHPSEPNYVYFEAGTNSFSDITFSTDGDPTSSNSTSSTSHLSTLLTNKSLSWKSYQENMPDPCPIFTNTTAQYAPKHDPFVFFQDVSGNPPSSTNANCASHHVALTTTQLQNDLNTNNVANYNFLTPNLCNDMHDCSVTTGDTWLSTMVPIIMNSNIYKQDGLILITWDEGTNSTGNNPIGMIVLSPFAKQKYVSTLSYSHASMVRTIENIFGLTPYIGHANDSGITDLSDFFGTTTTTPTTNPTPTPTPTGVPVTPTPTSSAATATATTTPVPCPTLPSDAVVTTTVTLPESGQYTVWSRLRAADTTNNSYYLQVDNQCGINVGDSATDIPVNTWTWVNYHDGSTTNTISMPLTAGSHVIKMIAREQNIDIDRILFSDDPSCTPTGTGDNCLSAATVTPAPATGTVTYRNSTSTNNGAGATTITLSVPTGTTTSDVMLAQITVNGASTTITPPSGWTMVQNIGSTSSLRMESFVKIASASEPATYAFTLSSSQPAAGGISTYTGVDTLTPIDASSSKYNTSVSTASVNQVTTTVPNDMLVFLVGVGANSTVTPATGFVERFDVNNGTATNGRTSELSDEVQATVGTTSVGSATSAASGISNLTQLIALKAATTQPTNTPTPVPPTPTPTSAPAATATPTSTSATATPTASACVTPVTIPTNLSPSGTIQAVPTTLTWSAITGVTYAIRVDDTQNTWSGSCTSPNAGDICQNGLTTNSFTFTPQAGHSYTWWVNAVDACGNWSSNSVNSSLTASSATTPTNTPAPTNTPIPTATPTPIPGDTTPPSSPTNVTATAFSYSQVNLSWTASTDNVGVTNYYIVRNGVTIGSSSGTTYTDSTVTASTSYSYQVIATDAAGNSSASSNTATVTTPAIPDTQAPTAPSNLTATAVSASQINLNWTAATDNVGVTGYDVYRNNTKIATVATTSFGDTGLIASTTYSYYVQAKDAAGNVSVSSNTASAVTSVQVVSNGTITGTIFSSTGGTVNHANVSTIVNGSTRSVTTGSQGGYSLTNLPPATYTVTYSASKYATQKQNITVASGQTVVNNVTLKKL